jgi:hypothetical protein
MPEGADAHLRDPPISRRELWRALADPWRTDVTDAVVRALREVGTPISRATLHDALDVNDLDEDRRNVAEQWLSLWLNATREGETDNEDAQRGRQRAVFRWAQVTAQLGGTTALNETTSIEDVRTTALAALEAADVVPQLAIGLPSGFFDSEQISAAQRRRWIAFISDLADVCDVRLAVTGRQRRLLAKRHGDLIGSNDGENSLLLPSDLASAGAEEGRPHERAQEARDALDLHHPAVRLLVVLGERASGSARLRDLTTDVRLNDVSREQQHNRVDRLAEHDLVDDVDVDGDRRVSLRPAGRKFLSIRESDLSSPDWPAASAAASRPSADDGVTGESGQQSSDSDSDSGASSDPPNSDPSAVFTPREDGEGGSPADAAPAEGGWMRADRHHALYGAAPEGGLAFCERPIYEDGDGRNWLFNAEKGRREVAVSSQLSRKACYSYLRLASALVGSRARSEVLTRNRLAGDPSKEGLDGLAISNEIVLRDGRGLGGVPDGCTATQLRENLTEWLCSLREMAGNLARSWSDETASELTSGALGLIHTAVHLYDLLDYDLAIELRVPQHIEGDDDLKETIRQNLATLLSQGSAYDAYNFYKVVHEGRPDVRDDLLATPDVGEGELADYLGRIVVSGPDASQLHDLVEGENQPRDPQVDGKQFAPLHLDVDVVQGWRREAVDDVLSRILSWKRLEPTEAAIRTYLAVCDSVLDVAIAALSLGGEDLRREVELHEVRRSLVDGLVEDRDADRLVPSTEARAAGSVLAALLDSESALSTSDLAAAAGVTNQTIRNVRGQLEAMGLLDVVDDGHGKTTWYRPTLPFRDERRNEDDEEVLLPTFIEDHGEQWSLHSAVETAISTVGPSIAADWPDVWQRLLPYGDPPDLTALDGVLSSIDVEADVEAIVDTVLLQVGWEPAARSGDLWSAPAETSSWLGADRPDRQLTIEAAVDRARQSVVADD